MRKNIFVLNADQEECQKLCADLEKLQHVFIPLKSLEEVEQCLQQTVCHAFILDVDSFSLRNFEIRRLSDQLSGLPILLTSSKSFHPDLYEAFNKYIYACIHKPIDLDEVLYFIHAVFKK